MINRRLHGTCAVVVGLALTVGACASNQPQSTVIARNPQNVVAPPTIVAAIPTAVPVFGTATPTAPAPGTLSTATPVPAAVLPTATAVVTATPTSSDGLPGVAIAVPIAEGARLTVVGIEAGSSLNVRELPGVEHPVATSLSVGGQPAVATGRARLLDDGTNAIWYEITTSDAIGWASGSFLAPLAGTQPTSRWAEIGLAFDSPEQAVDGIRAAVLAQPGEGSPSVVVVAGPSADGERTSVTIDILGYLDDSVAGERLRIIGEAGPRGSFVISGIESTWLCQRGSANSEGLCP